MSLDTENAAAYAAKLQLTREINRKLDALQFPSTRAMARHLGATYSRIYHLRYEKAHLISFKALLGWALQLGLEVTLTVKEKSPCTTSPQTPKL